MLVLSWVRESWAWVPWGACSAWLTGLGVCGWVLGFACLSCLLACPGRWPFPLCFLYIKRRGDSATVPGGDFPRGPGPSTPQKKTKQNPEVHVGLVVFYFCVCLSRAVGFLSGTVALITLLLIYQTPRRFGHRPGQDFRREAGPGPHWNKTRIN